MVDVAYGRNLLTLKGFLVCQIVFFRFLRRILDLNVYYSIPIGDYANGFGL